MSNIKNIIAYIAISSAAIAYGASSQTATAPAGKDNFAIGYGAGYQSSGQNTNVVCIGTDAGMNSANNMDCVFIGKEAGKGISGKSGWLDINRRICDKSDNPLNGVDMEIKPILGGSVKIYGCTFAYGGGYDLTEAINVERGGDIYMGTGAPRLNIPFELKEPTFHTRPLTTLHIGTDGDNLSTFRIENGEFNVYTNGVKIGTLSFTPAQ